MTTANQTHDTTPAPALATAGAALEVSELSWHVGGRRIVDDVSLAVEPGEFVAVIGPNGAGKTSLFNLITGLVRASSGRITLGGADITALPPYRRARQGLGRTFQSSSLFTSMTVAENVELAAQARLGGALRLWRRVGTPARTRAADAIELARLGPRAQARAGALSHGEKRKLELAILFATRPSVILLDEPMAGMALEEVPELTEVIRDVHRGGATVLMVEHHMEVLLDVADRVAVLHHGALLTCDTPEAVTADPVVREAYLGEAL